MIRRVLPFLLPLLLMATLHAQPYPTGVAAGPARRIAELRLGESWQDYLDGVVADGNGFRAYYDPGSDYDLVRTVHIAGSGQPDPASDRPVFASKTGHTSVSRRPLMARRAGERTMLFWVDVKANLRVSPAAADGTALDSTGILLAPETDNMIAECNESRCLVQSFPSRSGGAVLGTIIDTDGRIVARLSPPSKLRLRAADPQGFLFLGDTGDLHAVRVDNAGLETFDAIIQFGGISERGGVTSSGPTADFDGHQYTVVWENANESVNDYATYAVHLGLGGSLSSPRRIADLDPTMFAWSDGSLVWNGSEHLYVRMLSGFSAIIPEYVPETLLSLIPLDRNLIPIGDPRPLSTPDGHLSSYLAGVAVNRGIIYAGWTEDPGWDPAWVRMYGAVIDATGGIVSRSGIAIVPLTQTPEAVASTEDITVAVFSEPDTVFAGRFRILRSQLRFVRVTRGGVVLDATPPLLTEDAESGKVVAAAVASDILVVWGESGPPSTFLQAAIIHTADGSVQRFALPIHNWYRGLAIGTNGTGWLVANASDLAAISRSGQVLNPAAVRFTSSFPSSVSIASDGNRYVIAWENTSELNWSDNWRARVALVNSDGSLAFTERNTDAYAYYVSVSFTGTGYLVASADDRLTWLTHVSKDGTPGASRLIAAPPRPPRLLAFGPGALLALDTGIAFRLTADGDLIDSKPFTLPFTARFNVMTATSTGSLLGLTTLPVDETNAVALQELTWSHPLRRAVANP